MSTPTLALRKLGYSVHPWRIGLVDERGRFREIAHLTFPRKQDAVPVLTALVALAVDWSAEASTWSDDARDAVFVLIESAPGWHVHQCGLHAWEP